MQKVETLFANSVSLRFFANFAVFHFEKIFKTQRSQRRKVRKERAKMHTDN